MTKRKTSLFMLPVPDWQHRACDICNALSTLQFRDTSTGHLFGECCKADMITADSALDQIGEALGLGLRRPTLPESASTNR
jgi:hypothetical protein